MEVGWGDIKSTKVLLAFLGVRVAPLFSTDIDIFFFGGGGVHVLLGNVRGGQGFARLRNALPPPYECFSRLPWPPVLAGPYQIVTLPYVLPVAHIGIVSKISYSKITLVKTTLNEGNSEKLEFRRARYHDDSQDIYKQLLSYLNFLKIQQNYFFPNFPNFPKFRSMSGFVS